MSTRIISVTCIQCGHTWSVNLDELTTDQIIYRNNDHIRREEYRMPCPVDGTWNIITVEIKAQPTWMR